MAASPALTAAHNASLGSDPELLRELQQAVPEQPPKTSPAEGLVQSLNPDLSAIVEADFGAQRRPSLFSSAEDPVLTAQPSESAAGFTVQEIEVAMTAIADPYLKAEVYLTVERLGSLGVEEAMATTTSLPWNLQAKAGTFRSAFGRQNGQHLHVQDFTRRPVVNTPFLGDDGMRGPGAQISWLSPLPIWVTLYGEAFSLRPPELPSAGGTRPPPAGTFGGGGAADLTYATEAKAFVPFGEQWSVLAGVSAARGISPGLPLPAGGSIGAGRTTWLFGGDVYVKWKPPNVAHGYHSLTWQTEVMLRRLGEGGGLPAEWDGGLYSQVVLQFARPWQAGVRGEAVGLPRPAFWAGPCMPLPASPSRRASSPACALRSKRRRQCPSAGSLRRPSLRSFRSAAGCNWKSRSVRTAHMHSRIGMARGLLWTSSEVFAMLPRNLTRLFPFVLAVAWTVTAAHTVRAAADLGSASARLADAARLGTLADACACASGAAGAVPAHTCPRSA